jgi:hypothetical protein
MNKFRRVVLWLGLALIILLIVLSIYGAFLGANRARNFFGSLPLSVYWLSLALLLIAGLVVFRRLVRVPGLLLIHLGCVLILAGSMWGSNAGHKLQKQLFRIDKIPRGRMVIFEGHSTSLVQLEDDMPIDAFGRLPFSIKLKNFRIEYYKPGYLHIEARQGQRWKLPVEIGVEFSLGPNFGTVKILRAFENFKITIDGDKRTAFDDPRPGYNPALEVEIKQPDGAITTQYAFEWLRGHFHEGDKFLLSYHRAIRDYISELQVIKNKDVVAEKSIEVNHPLHFGGYHFHQHKYDAHAGQYTLLMVVSDSGLNVVYTGFVMLCVGVFWHLWLRGLSFRLMKRKSK